MVGHNRIHREILLRRHPRSPARRAAIQESDMLLSNLRKMRASSAEAAFDLQLLAREIADPKNYKRKIILTTGLGLSDKGVPLRLPALVVYGLKILQELQAVGRVDSKYIIYQATDFIIETNRLKKNVAKAHSAAAVAYLRGFVNEFFPSISDHVHIVAGVDCAVSGDALHAASALLKTHEEMKLKTEIEVIKEYGRNHKGQDSYLLYASANVILNGGYTPHYPLNVWLPPTPCTIIPLGGHKEKPFFNLTRGVAALTESAHSIIPLIVPTGEFPTYYPYKKGDLLMSDDEEALRAFIPSREIACDFSVLNMHGATLDRLGKIATRMLLQKDREDVANGYSSATNRCAGWDGPTG